MISPLHSQNEGMELFVWPRGNANMQTFFPEMVVLHTGWLLIIFPCKITGLGIPGFEKISKLANNKKQTYMQVI